MNLLSWRFPFIFLLFAINIYEGETSKPNHSRLRQKNNNRNHGKTTHVIRNPTPQKSNSRPSSRRISESKCLEYIRERNQTPKSKNFLVHSFAIGGRDALHGEFPHMGALGWRTRDGTWKFKCGSSLISHNFLLTAAHCSKIPLDSIIVKQVPEIVRLGDSNIIQGVFKPLDANIKRLTVHPQYVSPNKYYDIAVVELKSAIRFTKTIQPVCLWNRFDTSSLGTKVSATGWGVVNTVTKKSSPVLQAIDINIIDSALCDRLLRRACNKRWCGIREHQMCAGKLEGGVDACNGDSGGPLQVKKNLNSPKEGTMHILIGVTSFGIGCARADTPGVYTRVSSFIDWIERIVWPNQ